MEGDELLDDLSIVLFMFEGHDTGRHGGTFRDGFDKAAEIDDRKILFKQWGFMVGKIVLDHFPLQFGELNEGRQWKFIEGMAKGFVVISRAHIRILSARRVFTQ